MGAMPVQVRNVVAGAVVGIVFFFMFLCTFLLCQLKYAKAYSIKRPYIVSFEFCRSSLLRFGFRIFATITHAFILCFSECTSSLGLTSKKLPDSALAASSVVRWTIICVTCETRKTAVWPPFQTPRGELQKGEFQEAYFANFEVFGNIGTLNKLTIQ